MTSVEERRRFFRITDTLGVAWRTLTEEELADSDTFLNRPVDVYSMLGSLENKIAHKMGQFRIKDPQMAELIDLLNQKLNCITNQMEAESVLVQKLAHRMQEVNISACGVGFLLDEQLAIGQTLLLDLALRPSNVHVTCYGKVVGCDAASEGEGFYVRLDFCDLDEADQEMLIQHIVKRQVSLNRTV